MPVTRLAPSPTGALHLGNARTFLINWLMARQAGWKIILRIEDLDGPRVKSGADELAIQDLRWLGIDWDEGPIYQSGRAARYDEAIDELADAGYTFFCTCTRRDIEQAASAPHAADGSTVYSGRCRELPYDPTTQTPAAVRFRVPDEVIEFSDAFAGTKRFDVAEDLGDFVIKKNDGTAAYQLAVVVDDAEMNVTHVVRGDDLLDSTPRQILLYRAFEWDAKLPHYYHLPLVVGADGRRLAKRHGDTRLATYREAGVSAGRLLSLLARWSGINPAHKVEKAGHLLDAFNLSQVPHHQIVFTAEDDAYLRAG